MNWYKQAPQSGISAFSRAQQVVPLGADDYGELILQVDGEVKRYQLPYTAVGCYSDITNMIRKKSIKKLDKYLKWLEQFRHEDKKDMDVGVGSVMSKDECIPVIPAGT